MTPESWGPPVWTLFHTLSERIKEESFAEVMPQMFQFFFRICQYLPCPDCSKDATTFLLKIKVKDLKTKRDLVDLFYLFHNYVNAKKRKPLFNYGYINRYRQLRIVDVLNNFIKNYHTKGNMKQLTESFQREMVVREFKNWLLSGAINAFTTLDEIFAQDAKMKAEMEAKLASEIKSASESEIKSASESVIKSASESEIKSASESEIKSESESEQEEVKSEPETILRMEEVFEDNDEFPIEQKNPIYEFEAVQEPREVLQEQEEKEEVVVAEPKVETKKARKDRKKKK